MRVGESGGERESVGEWEGESEWGREGESEWGVRVGVRVGESGRGEKWGRVGGGE